MHAPKDPTDKKLKFHKPKKAHKILLAVANINKIGDKIKKIKLGAAQSWKQEEEFICQLTKEQAALSD